MTTTSFTLAQTIDMFTLTLGFVPGSPDKLNILESKFGDYGTAMALYATGTSIVYTMRRANGLINSGDAGYVPSTYLQASVDGGNWFTPSSTAPDEQHRLFTVPLGAEGEHYVRFRVNQINETFVLDGEPFLTLTGASPAIRIPDGWTQMGDVTSTTGAFLSGPGSDPNFKPAYGLADSGGVHKYGPNPPNIGVRGDFTDMMIATSSPRVYVSVDGQAPDVITQGDGYPCPFRYAAPPGVHDYVIWVDWEADKYLAVGGFFNGSLSPPPYMKRHFQWGTSISEGAGTNSTHDGYGRSDACGLPPRIGRVFGNTGVSGESLASVLPRIDYGLTALAATFPLTADDIITYEIGRNDNGAAWNDTYASLFNQAMDKFRAANSMTKIVVRGNFPGQNGTTHANATDFSAWHVFDEGLKAAVAARNDANIIYFDVELDDKWLSIATVDDVHPSIAGYNKMVALEIPFYRARGFALNKPTSLSLASPGLTILNAPTVLVPALNFPAWGDTPVTIDDSHGGAFTPPVATILAGQVSASVSYLALAAGILVLTATSSDPSISGASNSIFVTPQSLSLSVPGSIVQYVESTNFTVAIDGIPLAPATVTPSDGGAGGTFHPASVVINASHLSATFTYTAQIVGLISFTVANSAGITNSPPVVRTATALPPIDGDGTLATWPAELTATVPVAPDGEALLSVPFDPGDRARIKVDNTARSFGRTIEGIEFCDFDAASKDLGWRVGVADERPILDKTNHAAAIHVECDLASQQSAAFAGAGMLVTPTIRFRFTNGEAAEVSFPFMAKQL